MHRRRGPLFVTKTACNECRKGRAKCDGLTPCGRCRSKSGLKCEYEIPVHVRKEEMRQELNELRNYHEVSEKVFGLLRSTDKSSLVISRLQQQEPLEHIVEELGGFSLGSESNPSPHVRGVSPHTDRANSIDLENQSIAGDISHGLDDTVAYSFKHGSRWTEVPLSNTAIEHLMLLYFCWEYPIFSSISMRPFARDFNTGRTTFCSSLLVNGILAVGSRFSDQTEVRTDPEDINTAGMHCYLEAERLLSLCYGERSVTVVQGMCLMSMWNASRGDYKNARYYSKQAIQKAVEAGLHQDSNASSIPNDIREVHSTAFWGAFMSDQAWSLATGCLPHLSRDSVIHLPTASDLDDLKEWIPYTGDEVSQGFDLRQPGNVYAVYRSLCELSIIIHRILYAMYADADSRSSRDILKEYTQMLAWYSSLPEVLRLGENTTPSVLFVHMYYHFSLILVFYPLMNFEFHDSNITAVEICTDAANAVTTLARFYEGLHGLRRTPCFLPYIIFASGIAHLGAINLPINPIDALTKSAQEVAILQITSLYHGSSKRACRILLTRALYPNTANGTGEEDSKPGVPPWEPFARTMAWPADDSRRRESVIEASASIEVSNDVTLPYREHIL